MGGGGNLRKHLITRLAAPLLLATATIGLGGNVYGEQTIEVKSDVTFENLNITTDTTIILNGGTLKFNEGDDLGIIEEASNDNGHVYKEYVLGDVTPYVNSMDLNDKNAYFTYINNLDPDKYSDATQISVAKFKWGDAGGTLDLGKGADFVINSAFTNGGSFTKEGVGFLGILANSVQFDIVTEKGTFKCKNNFGDVEVKGGVLSINGPTTYKNITVSGTYENNGRFSNKLVSTSGKQTINGELVVSEGASAIFDATDKYVDGATTLNIDINNNVKVDSAILMMLGKVEYKSSEVSNSNGGRIIVNANGINTKIDNSNSNIYVTDIQDYKLDASQNKWFVTEDIMKNKTAIEWEAARENIDKAIENEQFHKASLSGDGKLILNSYQSTMLDAKTEASYNGTTLVMDGDYSDWKGTTNVSAGTLVVTAGKEYGTQSDNSKLNVYGEVYSPIKNEKGKVEYYNVNSCGMLALYRGNDITAVPTINTNTFALSDGSKVYIDEIVYNNDKIDVENTIKSDAIVGGARLWLDADNATNGTTLATIQSKEIKIGTMAEVWYDRISALESSAKLTVQLNKDAKIYQSYYTEEDYNELKNNIIPDILEEIENLSNDNTTEEIEPDNSNGRVSIEGGRGNSSSIANRYDGSDTAGGVKPAQEQADAYSIIEKKFNEWNNNNEGGSLDEITDKQKYLNEFFGQAQLVKAEYDETTGAIKVNAIDAAEFAANYVDENNNRLLTDKELEYAKQLDANRTSETVNGIGGEDSKTTQDFYDALYNETDRQKVAQTIKNLSRGSGIENVPTMTQHLGAIGSPFAAGLGSGGVSTRGQEENM
ncbi:MAG: hypothetical protein Q4C70_07350, partial [Planctomycetia bacterium]|nr:hypothetical protein [Planctomycetia bacterium]